MKTLIVLLIGISFSISQQNITVYTSSRDGKVHEFENKLMEEIFRIYEIKNKVKLNVTNIPLKTFADGFKMIKEAGSNEVCVINSVTITDERKAMYNFSSPYIPTRDAILVMAAKKMSDPNVWKKRGTRIGFTPGTTGEEIIKDLKEQYGITGVPFSNRTERLAALSTGKVDYVVGDNILAWDDPKFAVLQEIEGRKTGYFGIMFSKDSKIKANFDQIFNYYIKSPTFRKLTTRVFGSQITEYFKKNL